MHLLCILCILAGGGGGGGGAVVAVAIGETVILLTLHRHVY